MSHDPATLERAAARTERVGACSAAAEQIRLGVLEQGEAQGEGYVGQGLGAADIMAVIYHDALRFEPSNPQSPERDRFLLSVGHYALLLYSALASAGVLDRAELATYAADGSRLPMSAMSSYTPGVEISGGSLGHGLGLAAGMCLGLRAQGRDGQRVFTLFSDGELNEGSTWEAAMVAASWQLGNLIAVVDMNGLQADGPTREVLAIEPQDERWRAFGWDVQRVNGNDIGALLDALDAALGSAQATGRPHIIIADTRVGCGVPLLENREKAHFMKIAEEEWAICKQQLAETARARVAQ